VTDAHLDDLRAAALDYAGLGWSVLPIGPGKRPALRAWKRHQAERADESTIAGWFAPGALRGRVRGVGVVLGPVSGELVARDFDEADGYRRWAAEHPDLAGVLPTAETSRGFHVYATIPEARTLKLSDGELRAAGAYVVAPPSVHPSGALYRWTVPLPDGPVPMVDPRAFGIEPAVLQSKAATALWLEHPVRPVCLERPEHLGHPAHLVRHLSLDDFIAEAIVATVPAGIGGRNDGTFQFVRRLKARPELRDQAAIELRSIARQWYEAAKPTIGTLDFDTTWSDFGHAWERARTAYGDALGDALWTAEQAADPNCASGYDDPRTRLLVKLCRELQARAGDRPFFLAGDRAAEAVGLEPRQANRRLAMLVRDGRAGAGGQGAHGPGIGVSVSWG
jgi:hypothetical protein